MFPIDYLSFLANYICLTYLLGLIRHQRRSQFIGNPYWDLALFNGGIILENATKKTNFFTN